METVQPKQSNLPEEIPVYEFSTDRTQKITLSDISRSIRRESGLVGIRQVPVQFWELYAILMTLLTDSDVNYVIGDIHVQSGSSKAYLTDTEKNAGYTSKLAPVDRWRHDKAISVIQLPNILESDQILRNAAVGLTINKEGVLVAFGMNLHECDNFNVLGGQVIRSYSYGNSDATPWEVMKVKLVEWVKNLKQLWKVQNKVMNRMQGHNLPADIPIIEELIGDLYLKAIRQAYFKGGFTPFDTHELSNFAQEMIKSSRSQERLATLWDIYNWGTSIMKPGIVDIGEIANNSNMWANYLLEKYELSVPEAEIIK